MNPTPLFPLEQRFEGRFSSTDRQELVAIFEGCESHADNYGGAWLLRQDGSKWSPVRYDAGFHPQSCRQLKLESGRDLLVCNFTDIHQGYTRHSLLTYDFSVPGAGELKGWTTLVEVVDSTRSCAPPQLRAKHSIGELKAPDIRDINGDGALDVGIEGWLESGAPTDAYWKACERYHAGHDVSFAGTLSQRQVLRFEFIQQGSVLKPTARTRRALGRLPR